MGFWSGPNQSNDSENSGMCMATRNRLSPAKFIDANRWRVTPQEALQRFAERAAREAADTRTPAQRWLNDPPPGRSALAQVRNVAAPVQGPAPRRSAGVPAGQGRARGHRGHGGQAGHAGFVPNRVAHA
jgi:hypothetical protein